MNPTAPLRILIADDHAIIREGLTALLNSQSACNVVGEAVNGQEALLLYRQHRPDVVLMDMLMPRMNGLQATMALRQEFPHAKVILLTVSDREEDIVQTLQAGAKAYLLKEANKTVIVDTIKQVAAGQTCIPADVASKLVEHTRRVPLTKREKEVLEHITEGQSNQEIGNALFIAEGTVKAHINSIFQKLGVRDRTQAIITALQRGLVKL